MEDRVGAHGDDYEARPYAEAMADLRNAQEDWAAWGPAWARHLDLHWVGNTHAVNTMRAIDGPHPGSCFCKQMLAMPEAMLPGEHYRGESMWVVREPAEAGYMSDVLRYEQDADLGDFPTAPHKDFVHLPTPFLGRPGYEVPYPLLTAARTFRTHERRPGMPHLVGWHQVEYPACPVAARGNHYARPPAGLGALAVPFGAMVPLPPSQAYLESRLMSGESMAEGYLISEWAVLAVVYLVEQERSTHRLWLYQQGLIDAIRDVVVDFICTGPKGKEHAVSCTLEALLALTEELPSTANFEARLQQERPMRRDRGSWVMVRVERGNDGWKAMVDEDIPP